MLEELSRNSVIGQLPKWLLLHCSPDPRRGLFIGASFQKHYTWENTFERRVVLRSKDFQWLSLFSEFKLLFSGSLGAARVPSRITVCFNEYINRFHIILS